MTNKFYTFCLAILMVCISNYTMAQNNNTSSPFSAFGFGELSNKSTGRSNAMGGTAIGMRFRDQINPANPASYTARDSMSMVFEMGASGKQTRFASNGAVNNTNDSNFDYIALSFRIQNGIALAFGLQPYTNRGYSMSSTLKAGTTEEATVLYSGDGSVSKFFFGTGVKLFKNLSLGINANYYFGTLTTNSSSDFKQTLSSDIYFNNTNRIRGLGVDAGLQYQLDLDPEGKGPYMVFGATAKFNTKLKRDYDILRYYSNHNITSGGSVTSTNDTIQNMTGSSKDVNLPLGLGLGASYNVPNKLTLSADFYMEDWSDYNDNVGYATKDVTYGNRYIAAAGVEWIPEKFALRNYLKRISYRAGVRMEQDYIKINGNNINTYAVTAGIGLPIARQRSTLNIGVEFGTKGSSTSTTFKQDYTKLYISFALHDYWFFKRKID
ncbi:hypothetical protein K5X82_14575 [Halosquirtibacter xylanolyticus]|uniref:hypothetical protein n=1 Tax=Halosquirtibacter xylanolyticus TaxID=3374599 RepID=UPI0037497FD1|nr:hypothetical protein K5X82_14575 [Prolixibacteraceae bacterium]